MLKRPITYTDLDGKNVTKNFYFNLTVPEVSELEFRMDGSTMSTYWAKMVEDKNAGAMLRAFKDLISASYGVRDGEEFLKETESGYSLGRRFLQHPAYSALFLELLGPDADNEEFFKNFLLGVVPSELRTEMVEKSGTLSVVPDEIQDASVPTPVMTPTSISVVPQDEAEAGPKKAEDHSRDELLAMSQEEFDVLAGTDPQKMSPAVLQVAFQRKATGPNS